MKKPFFARHALLILLAVFFFVPFAMRGSRYAVQRMKNDVKDWLPANFEETKELDWFRERFLGEQFVIVSWDGCTGTVDDQRFMDFVDQLFPEMPPSARLPRHRQEDYVDRSLDPARYVRSFTPSSNDQDEAFIGNKLSLRAQKDSHFDWGGQREKWIRSGKSDWVYITPNGQLWQWKGNQSWPAQLGRQIVRSIWGKQPLKRELIADFDLMDGPWYYEDPSRLNARLFKSIYSGPSVLSQLTDADGKMNIPVDEAHERIRGVMFGPDDEQTCIVVTLTEAAKRDPRALVGRGMLGKERGALLDLAEKAGVQAPRPPPALPGLLAGLFEKPEAPNPNPMLRLGGPPVDNAAIDEEGQITLARLLGLSLAVGLGLSWLCFRSINITIMVFLVGGLSAVTSVGIVYWTGSQLDAVLMSMPSLVYVLGISGAVHVVNYYRESVAETGLETAPDRAVGLGLWPCTMAAFTTSLGLISLASSNITPIRKFGIYAAVGVIATLILLFTYLPAALEMWPPRRYLKRAADDKRKESEGDGDVSPASAVEKFLDRFWQGVAKFVIAHYRLVGFGCALVLITGAIGLTKIDSDVQLLKLFDGKAKIIEDYKWLEANLGKLVPMEIVVCVAPELHEKSVDEADLDEAVNNPDEIAEVEEPNPLGLDFLQRMNIARDVAAEIDKVFGDGKNGLKQLSRPMVASTFATAAPTGLGSEHTIKVYKKELEANKAGFVEAGFLRDDPEDQSELWRISLRLAALDDIDFGVFVQQVQRVVEPVMLAYEYRESILQRLSPFDQDEPPRVFFVGYKESKKDAAGEAAEPLVDQDYIFTEHVVRLLSAEGISISKKYWNITKEEHLEHVRPSDTIIVLNDVPEITMQALNATSALRFDARNNEFRPLSDPTARQRGQKVSAVYTGLVPIVYKAQRELLESLIYSTGLAFVMIAVVMMLLLRSPRAGLLSMFPNVFPVVLVFGIMGWMEVLVDIGSMMTASVAMGVAVDDTIHFLSWFRKALDEGHERKQAILVAYRRVATAMTQTTAIGGIGLSIFAFSTFTPTQRFGTLMLALLAAALIGDLLFLPALLASSLGRVFDRKPSGDGRGPSPHIEGIGEHRDAASSAREIKNLPTQMRHDDPHG